jgi:hypothetical protein
MDIAASNSIIISGPGSALSRGKKLDRKLYIHLTVRFGLLRTTCVYLPNYVNFAF